MAYFPHRRTLASSHPNPNTPIQPISRNPPSFTAAADTNNRQPPDPTTLPNPTIQYISNHFSKLHTNHKVLSSLKPSSIQQHPNQEPANSDSSSTSLTKSKSLNRRNPSDFQRVVEKPIKPVKKVTHEEQEIKREIIPKPEEFKKVVKKAEREFKKEVVEIKRSPISLPMAMASGRRRSFCCTETELADFFSRNGVRVVSADMPPFMQIHAVDFARKSCDSLEKFTARTLASTLKKEFDGAYGPAWHCIVGTSFGSFVTHSVGGFLYFSMDQKLYVLLFKTTVQRALD